MRRAGAAVLIVLACEGAAHAAPKIEDPQGTPVTITSTQGGTTLYLAKGDVPGGAIPDPFERIGNAPVRLRLTPGMYTIETTGDAQSSGHEKFIVDTKELTVEVHPGDVFPKTLGTVLEGLGVIAVLTGIVVLTVYTPHDQSFGRWAVGLPILLGGGASFGVGLGLNILGSTHFVLPSSAQALGVTGTVRF